jgi:hypothetical protein|tara:strand:+ start:93 stop:911 length:819 start_codon:yes stop_codon:yes gene_type:complete
MLLIFLFTADLYIGVNMLKDNFKPDNTNAIQLRTIYDIGVGVAKAFINNKDEEVFIWHEYHYGEWPLDPRRNEIKSILKNYGGDKVFQPWFKRLQENKEFEIANSEEVTKEWSKWGRRTDTLYTLSDETQILYKEYAGMGGSEREWRIISTGRYFNRVAYDISLPWQFSNSGYEHRGLYGLGRLICIKEPRYSQRKKMISYDLLFERSTTLSQVSISIFPNESFEDIYVLSYFGESFNIDEAEKYDYVKHIHTEIDNISLAKFRKSTRLEDM